MVPKVAGKGKSFKGAGLYYLHDKKARTSERVAFTQTLNVPTNDAERALRFMAFTALRQDELKAQSGAARTGRKLKDSVYTYSLSWAPGEQPTHPEMVEAARETLKVLGIEQHEALLVIHTDEPHPHIHVIVNRVHPETGLAAKLSNDHLELSKWAEAYERRQGQIRCEERVKNNEERRRRKKDGRSGFVKHEGEKTADARRRRADPLSRPPALEMNVSAWHREQRQALYDAKERRIAQRQAEIRARNRTAWAFMFRQQKAEARELDETRKSRFKALLYFLAHRGELTGPGGLKWIFHGLIGYHGADFWEAMQKRHEADRKRLADRVGLETREVIAEENALYRTELEALREAQKAERQTLRDEYAARSPALPGREKEPRAKAAGKEQADKAMRDEFTERVRKRIRKRKRDERKRDKGAGRERDE